MRPKITNEYIDFKLKGRTIKRIGDYKDSAHKVEFQCLLDAHKWFSKINDIFYGHGCPRCYHPFASLSIDEINSKIKDKPFLCLGKMKKNNNSKTKHIFKCLIDGHIWKTSLHHIFHSNSGCPKCNSPERITNEIFDKRIKNKKITRLGECSGNAIKVLVKCNICNHTWNTIPGNLFRDAGCPECATGKNEKRIGKLIEKYVKYDKLVRRGPLIYANERKYIPDFYLEIQNKQYAYSLHSPNHYQ